MLDESGDFYSYFYHIEKEEWLRWDYDIVKYNIQGEIDKPKSEEELNSYEMQNSEPEKIEFSSILI